MDPSLPKKVKTQVDTENDELAENIDSPVVPSTPGFPPRPRSLHPKAQDELTRIAGDFSSSLEAKARDLSKGMDEVQTTHVIKARNILLASGISELANFSVVILLPLGLFLLGIAVNPVIEGIKHQTGIPAGFFISAVIGALLFGGSIVGYSIKNPLIRFFAEGSEFRNFFSRQK